MAQETIFFENEIYSKTENRYCYIFEKMKWSFCGKAHFLNHLSQGNENPSMFVIHSYAWFNFMSVFFELQIPHSYIEFSSRLSDFRTMVFYKSAVCQNGCALFYYLTRCHQRFSCHLSACMICVCVTDFISAHTACAFNFIFWIQDFENWIDLHVSCVYYQNVCVCKVPPICCNREKKMWLRHFIIEFEAFVSLSRLLNLTFTRN